MTFQEAVIKARFGHRDWMSYRDKHGGQVVARLTVAGIKAALLAGGTKGHFTMIGASTGIAYQYSWRTGVSLIRNARFLKIPAAM